MGAYGEVLGHWTQDGLPKARKSGGAAGGGEFEGSLDLTSYSLGPDHGLWEGEIPPDSISGHEQCICLSSLKTEICHSV